MPTKPKKRAMSSDHKAALAEGRNQARAVGNYLEALEANKPKRGRPRTVDSVKKRLTTVEHELKTTSGLTRLSLLQERRDLGLPLADEELVEARVAKPYSARKGISYSAWREFGVSPEVLKKAGITRGA